jgi:hypothetical protein
LVKDRKGNILKVGDIVKYIHNTEGGYIKNDICQVIDVYFSYSTGKITTKRLHDGYYNSWNSKYFELINQKQKEDHLPKWF